MKSKVATNKQKGGEQRALMTGVAWHGSARDHSLGTLRQLCPNTTGGGRGGLYQIHQGLLSTPTEDDRLTVRSGLVQLDNYSLQQGSGL